MQFLEAGITGGYKDGDADCINGSDSYCWPDHPRYGQGQETGHIRLRRRLQPLPWVPLMDDLLWVMSLQGEYLSVIIILP